MGLADLKCYEGYPSTVHPLHQHSDVLHLDKNCPASVPWKVRKLSIRNIINQVQVGMNSGAFAISSYINLLRLL